MTAEYYLTQPQEVAKYQALRAARGLPPADTSWLDVAHTLAGDDDNVFNAMWSFWNFAHAFDDLLDESGWNAEQIEAAMATLHEAVTLTLMEKWAVKHVEAWSRLRHLLTALIGNASEMNLPLLSDTVDNFQADLMENPFIRQHAAEFRCIFVQAMTRCLDGDAMAKSDDERKRAVAPAVRCGDLDALFHMVYLARGWAALRACGNIRDYDLPDDMIPIIRKEAV